MKNNNLEKDFINANKALKHAAEEGIKDETPVETENTDASQEDDPLPLYN